MLKNIIIPKRIGNYFLFPEKILGFDISKNHLSAAQVTASGKNKIIIEKYFEEFFNYNNENVGSTLRNILLNVNKYDSIKVSLPSYLVIFKELTLPFTDISKIRSILDFEIESILPFSINEAVVDFIITNQDNKRKETTIFVAVARKKDVLELLEPFKNISVNPDSVVVDIFGIYAMLKSTTNNLLNNDIAIIDVEYNYTNIVYIQDGKLKLVRSIQQGLSSIAKNLSNDAKISFNDALEQLKSNSALNKKERDAALDSFLQNIIFTLSSFKSILPDFSEIKKIILFGKTQSIGEFDKLINSRTNISTEVFNVNSILSNNLKSNINLDNSSLLTVATAYPSLMIEDFNLLRKDLEKSNDKLLRNQIITAAALTFGILTAIIGYSYTQKRKLKRTVENSKSEIINTLKNRFDITDRSVLRNLSEVINTSNNKLNEEESIWLSFSSQTKFSFLRYLQELSTIIEKDSIGLNLKRLSIAQGVITLEGNVRDFNALQILENELNKSTLFSHITVPQETDFTIKLTIKKNEENV